MEKQKFLIIVTVEISPAKKFLAFFRKYLPQKIRDFVAWPRQGQAHEWAHNINRPVLKIFLVYKLVQ